MNCSTCGAGNPAGAATCSSCGAALADAGSTPTLSLPIGAKLQGGAFTIGRVLGQGGFGITYKGGDTQLHRFVAIKEFFPANCLRHGATVFPTGATTREIYERARQSFLREAGALARFSHPGIVRAFTVFEENNTAYMVMELLEGKSLEATLVEKGVLAEADAVRIAIQIAEALGAVHAAGMLHRDVKPDNILLTAPTGANQGRAVLIDFGTARKFTADKTSSMTAMLTGGYAPLEQYGTAAKFGPYTDVYALAATLYRCLTGQVPVQATDRLTGVVLQPPDRVNPNLSPTVAAAVMAGLSIKAPERPQSAAQFIALLQAPPPSPRVPAPPAQAGPPATWAPAPPTPQAAPQHPAAPQRAQVAWWTHAWHLIWVAAVLWFAYLKLFPDPVKADLIDYDNDKLKPAVALESQSIDAYDNALKEDDDDSIRADLRQSAIPLSGRFVDQVQAIDPQTDEVKALNDKLLALAKRRQAAYEAIANPNNVPTLSQWFDELNAVDESEKAWVSDFKALCKEHDVELGDPQH